MIPVTVVRPTDEPILIATFVGHVDSDMMLEMFRASDALTREGETIIYRISDCREANTHFADMMRIVSEAGRGLPGSSTDPRFHPVLVGTQAMVKLVADMLKQQKNGGLQVPIFHTIDDALEAIHLQMANAEQERNSKLA